MQIYIIFEVNMYVCVFLSVYQPEGQVEGYVNCPQYSCDGIQQTHLLGVELPALTGHTIHPHQTVASIKQPASTHAHAHTPLFSVKCQ